MQRDVVIFVTDQRQKFLAEILDGEKQSCNQSKNIDYSRVGSIIFPTPFQKAKFSDLELSELKENIEKYNISTWGGVMPPNFPGLSRGKDLMTDEQVILENAVVTAEATVSLAIQKSYYSISNSKVVVSGFGKCGRRIAELFDKMGAIVTVVARKECDRTEAKKRGYNAYSFDEYPEFCMQTKILVNTVPALVITEKIIRMLSKDAIIIDIASKPGGCDFEAAKRYQISCTHALGLPGIYCPKTSAKSVADGLKRNGVAEGLWIYQILR